MLSFFAAQHLDIGAAGDRVWQGFRKGIDFGKVDAGFAAEEVDGGIAGDATEPLGTFLGVFELIFTLERLDEGLLGQILGIGDIADNAVNNGEDTAKIFADKAVLGFPFRRSRTRVKSGRSRHWAMFNQFRHNDLHLQVKTSAR